MKDRKCPKCKKQYQGHPTVSMADNYTRICPNCAGTEMMISLVAGHRKVEFKVDERTQLEKEFDKTISRTHQELSKLIKKMKKEQNDERSRMGMLHKKMKEEQRNEEMSKM